MSVQSEISRISGNVAAALAAIAEKGVSVPSGSKSDALASLIASIEAGGGGTGGGFPHGAEWAACEYEGGGTGSRGLAYGDGLWVLSAQGLYYSTNGKVWKRTNVTSGYFNISAHRWKGKWYACSSTCDLYTSVDGKTWTKATTFDSSLTIQGGWASTSEYILLCTSKGPIRSTDGVTWSDSPGLGTGFDVRYIAGKFFFRTSAGVMYYSTDGLTWARITGTFSGKKEIITYGNGVYAALPSNGIHYSVDGVTWTASNITSGAFAGIGYSDGMFVASSATDFYYSSDGKTWTKGQAKSESTTGYAYFKHANGVWMWTASNYAARSVDGITWVNVSGVNSGEILFENGIWLMCSGATNPARYSVCWEPAS